MMNVSARARKREWHSPGHIVAISMAGGRDSFHRNVECLFLVTQKDDQFFFFWNRSMAMYRCALVDQ